VNWLHACYGVGATIGPLLMTSMLMADRPWQWGYGRVAPLIAGADMLRSTLRPKI